MTIRMVDAMAVVPGSVVVGCATAAGFSPLIGIPVVAVGPREVGPEREVLRVVTLDGGIEFGVRPGMRLFVHGGVVPEVAL